MAKPTVLLAINTLTSIGASPYMDHMRLAYELGRKHTKYNFHQMVGRRINIDRFRNIAARQCLMAEYDYLFFIDDDMLLDKDCFGPLMAAKLDIVSAHTYIRGYPFDIMSFKYKPSVLFPKSKNLVPLVQEDIQNSKLLRQDGVIMCDAIGTAVSLIKVSSTIAKMHHPWFLTSPQQTEDIYFCIKAKQFNPKIRIGMHTKVICGHQLDPEFINSHSRDDLMKYYESCMHPDTLASFKENIDHGSQYIKDEIEPVITVDKSAIDPEAMENLVDQSS